MLFSRVMDASASRHGRSSVAAGFSDGGNSGFTLGLSDLVIETAVGRSDLALAGLSLGMSPPASVRAISRVLLGGMRLGGGAAGGGGASGGGGLSGARLNPDRLRFDYGFLADNWREVLSGGGLNSPSGTQGRFPGLGGSAGGPFTQLPPGLLGNRRPWHRLPERIRERLKTLLAGLRGSDDSTGADGSDPGLPSIPGGPPVTGDPSGSTGEVVPNPEPSSLALMGIGLASVAGMTWRRRRRPEIADEE